MHEMQQDIKKMIGELTPQQVYSYNRYFYTYKKFFYTQFYQNLSESIPHNKRIVTIFILRIRYINYFFIFFVEKSNENTHTKFFFWEVCLRAPIASKLNTILGQKISKQSPVPPPPNKPPPPIKTSKNTILAHPLV